MLSSKLFELWDSREPPSSVSVPTYDDEGTCELFFGLHHYEVESNELWKHTSTLTFMTDEAFGYYISVFLRYIIERKANFMEVVGALQAHFDAPKGNVNRPSYKSRLSFLSKEQLILVIEVLIEVAKDGFIDADDPSIESLKQAAM